MNLSLNKRFYFFDKSLDFLVLLAPLAPTQNRIVNNFGWNRSHRFLCAKVFLTLKFGLLQVIGYSKTWQNFSRFCPLERWNRWQERAHARTHTQTKFNRTNRWKLRGWSDNLSMLLFFLSFSLFTHIWTSDYNEMRALNFIGNANPNEPRNKNKSKNN